MFLELKGNPKSTSHIYKTKIVGRYATLYMTAEGKAIKESYSLQARVQRDKILKGNLKINIRLYFGDKRKRDIDNYNKLLLDSLSGICYEDDSQIQIMEIRKLYSKENPRIEVELNEL